MVQNINISISKPRRYCVSFRCCCLRFNYYFILNSCLFDRNLIWISSHTYYGFVFCDSFIKFIIIQSLDTGARIAQFMKRDFILFNLIYLFIYFYYSWYIYKKDNKNNRFDSASDYLLWAGGIQTKICFVEVLNILFLNWSVLLPGGRLKNLTRG